MNPYGQIAEMIGHTSTLPNTDIFSLKNRAVKIWEEQKDGQGREEMGAFQAFDFSMVSAFSFFSDYAREMLEGMVNRSLDEDGYPIKIRLTQNSINGFATATYDVIVLDNSASENWQELN